MPGWIIAAAIGSIAITAVLTFVLWRLNAPMLARGKQDRDGSGDGALIAGDGGRRADDHSGSDGSADGGDGGGGD